MTRGARCACLQAVLAVALAGCLAKPTPPADMPIVVCPREVPVPLDRHGDRIVCPDIEAVSGKTARDMARGYLGCSALYNALVQAHQACAAAVMEVEP